MDSVSSEPTGLVIGNHSETPTRTSNHENQEQTDALSAPFRFLDLPVEIRLRIYRYLAPNTPTPPFRDDGPCCPAILRTNQTIYEEAMAEWYSFMPYKASIACRRLQLFKLMFSPDDPLPWMFRAIRFLELTIVLVQVPMPGRRCDPAPYLALQRILHACFPPGPTGLGNLQRLHVTVGFMPPFFCAYRGQPDQLRRALYGNLSALQNLHGSVEVVINIYFPPVVDRVYGLNYPTAPLLAWKAEFMAILRNESENLLAA